MTSTITYELPPTLDVSILNMRDIRRDNAKFRLDDGYFARLPVATQHLIDNLPHVSLGSICSTFRKGIFDIKASSYAQSGVPFLRIGNLRNGLIDPTGLAFITPERHRQEAVTALRFGDIVLSKTAYAAAALVTVPECNVSQDIIAVRLSTTTTRRFWPGFVVAYLNSRYGCALLHRQFQGNVQAHLSLPDARKIPVPLFSGPFQECVHDLLLEAHRLENSAESHELDARNAVPQAVGLERWTPPLAATYTKRWSTVQAAGRFDAEYFAPAAGASEIALQGAGALGFFVLADLITTLTNGHTPLRHDLRTGEVPFLCAEHVSDFECNFASAKHIRLTQHTTELARTALRSGDVLLSIKGRIGNVAIVEDLTGPVNINQDVALLRLNNLLPKWWTVAFLNSFLGKLQIQQLSTGGINPFLGLANVRKLRIPYFEAALMQLAADGARVSVHAARESRQNAERLLSASFRAVEIAIESGEAAGLLFAKSASR